jgi:hypothetical protein
MMVIRYLPDELSRQSQTLSQIHEGVEAAKDTDE